MRTLLLVLLAFLSVDSIAQQVSYNFTFNQSDLSFTQNGIYDVVALDKGAFIDNEDNIGNPMLAAQSVNILLPPNTKILNVTYSVNSELLLPGNYYLYPVQPPHYANFSKPPDFVPPNPAVYESATPFPVNNILNYSLHGFREYNYAEITFIPFNYIPVNRELHLITDITLIIDYVFVGNIEKSKLRAFSSEDNLTYSIISNNVFNKSDGTGNFPDNQASRDWINNYIITAGLNTMANLTQMNISSSSPYIHDSRIRFVVDNIFFWNDDYGWDMQNSKINSTTGNTLYQTYVINNPLVSNKYHSVHVFCG